MHKTVFVNGRICDGEGILDGHCLIVENGLVADVCLHQPDELHTAQIYDLSGHFLAPGFIDLQVNGGGGELFNNAPTPKTLRTIARAHRRFGTTGFLPTIISATDAVMQRAISSVSEALRNNLPGILGIHLEGPCLNVDRKGIHSAQALRKLDDSLFSLFTSLQKGTTLVTLAPEFVDARQIRALTDAGVLVFAGHTTADFETTQKALDAGLRGFTHLFNAMPALLSREPGIVGAALTDTDSYFGIIADGHHVHPASFAVAVAAKRRGGALLVTDAMACVGTNQNSFVMNEETIQLSQGRFLSKEGILAGSNLNMQDAVKNTIKFTGLEITEALRMASTYPAHAIHKAAELGYIKAGYRACLVELDTELNVVETWIDGIPGREDL